MGNNCQYSQKKGFIIVIKDFIKRNYNFIEKYFPLLSTIPAIIIIILVVGFPTVYAFYTGFFEKNLLTRVFRYVGINNYIKMVHDPKFWEYLENSAIYVIGSVITGFILALILALALYNVKKFRKIFLTIILLPWLIPIISAAIMWKWVFHDLYGLLNIILLNIGLIKEPIVMMSSGITAMVILIWVDVWSRVPFATLILFAGMQRISEDIFDAARIDGAKPIQVLTQIFLPLIRPEVLIVLVVQTMFVFREVGLPYVLTGGGPGSNTETLALYIYRTGNMFLRQGYASALSITMLLITVCFVLVYFKVILRKEESI